MRTLIFGVLLAACCCVSCGREEQLTFSTDSIAFTLEGPLFSGPNTAQATLPGGFSDFLQKNGLQASQVTAVRLSKASLQAASSGNFDACEQAVLQMVSDQSPMTRLAVLNPVPQGQQQLSLQVSTEQEATPFFQAAPATLLVDLNLRADTDSSFAFTGRFDFLVTVRR